MPERLSPEDRLSQAANLSLNKLQIELQNLGNRTQSHEIQAGVTESFLDYIATLAPFAGLHHADALVVIKDNFIAQDPTSDTTSGIHMNLYLPFQQMRYTFQSSHNYITPDLQQFLPGTDEFVGFPEIIEELEERNLTYKNDGVEVRVERLGTDMGRLSLPEMETIDINVQTLAKSRIEKGLTAPIDTFDSDNSYVSSIATFDKAIKEDQKLTSLWLKAQTKEALKLIKQSQNGDVHDYEEIQLSDQEKERLFTVQTTTKNLDEEDERFKERKINVAYLRLNTQTGELEVVPLGFKNIKRFAWGEEAKPKQSFPAPLSVHLEYIPKIVEMLRVKIPSQLRKPYIPQK